MLTALRRRQQKLLPILPAYTEEPVCAGFMLLTYANRAMLISGDISETYLSQCVYESQYN